MFCVLRRNILGQVRRYSSCTFRNQTNTFLRPVAISKESYRSQPCTAFGISTIVLAVENTALQDELNEYKKVVEPTTPTNVPSIPTVEPSIPTSTPSIPTDLSSTPEEIISSTTLTTTTTKAPPMDDYRLPEFIIPESYDLTLSPDLKTGLFKGKTIIKVKVLQDTDVIKIHSNGLMIEKVLVNDEEAKFELVKKFELLVISKKNGGRITKGTVDVNIVYSGNMTEGIVGLYRSEYVNEQGKKRY